MLMIGLDVSNVSGLYPETKGVYAFEAISEEDDDHFLIANVLPPLWSPMGISREY